MKLTNEWVMWQDTEQIKKIWTIISDVYWGIDLKMSSEGVSKNELSKWLRIKYIVF